MHDLTLSLVVYQIEIRVLLMKTFGTNEAQHFIFQCWLTCLKYQTKHNNPKIRLKLEAFVGITTFYLPTNKYKRAAGFVQEKTFQ